MRRALGGIFGVLALICAALWLTGILGAVLIPLLPAAKAESIGAVGFAVSGAGEIGVYVFGFIADRARRSDKRTVSKYGLR
jgi:hypothetical protein